MTGFITFVHHDAKAASRAGESWLPESGVASYYGRRQNGRRTADGTRFNKNAMTAAHSWLPFGTRVLVTCRATGRSVIVTINDRIGTQRRIIDLSVEAARKLGMLDRGVVRVSLSPE